jgi:hypothetical protein
MLKTGRKEGKGQNYFNLLAQFCIFRKPKGKNPKKHLGLRKSGSIPSINNIRWNWTHKRLSSSFFPLVMPEGIFHIGYLTGFVHKTPEGVP